MSDKKKQDPGLAELERAKVEAELSKKRLASSLSTLQERLKPGNLASEAWGGVRDKSGELADNTLQTVKDRPVAASGIIAAIAIYLAREPLWKLAVRFFTGEDGKDLVTTKVSRKDDNYDLAAPAVSRSIDEGVSA